MNRIIKVAATDAVASALIDQLAQWPALADRNVTVEYNEPLNSVPARCPWIGVYEANQTLLPRTLGVVAGFRRQTIDFALVLRESSVVSGTECGKRMAVLVKGIEDAILSDATIRGTCEMLGEQFSVQYTSYRVDGQHYLKEAVVQFSVIAVVQVDFG